MHVWHMVFHSNNHSSWIGFQSLQVLWHFIRNNRPNSTGNEGEYDNKHGKNENNQTEQFLLFKKTWINSIFAEWFMKNSLKLLKYLELAKRSSFRFTISLKQNSYRSTSIGESFNIKETLLIWFNLHKSNPHCRSIESKLIMQF